MLTVDSSITILISLTNHLINLVISQLLADRCHDMTKLSSGDKAIVIAVEDLVNMISLGLQSVTL